MNLEMNATSGPMRVDGSGLSGSPELLTVDEVAAMLRVNKSWVYEHVRKRGGTRAERLPYIKLGKYVRFEPAAVRAYIAGHSRAR